MKTTKKNFIVFVATLLMATSAWAGDITVIKKLNGTVNNSAGEVTYEVSATNGQCTLTVKPSAGNYIESITAEKTVSGNVAQTRKAPGIAENLDVTTDATADPSGTTTWTFTMPSNDYNVEVVANFQQCIDISTATVTLATTSFNYNGEAKTPAVSSVVLGDNTIAATNYEVVYGDDNHNNINAGTVTVYVTGKGIYTGTATATFTINKIDISPAPTVALEGWTFGNQPQTITPTVEGNLGGGAVTYTYKAAGATEFTTTVPQNAGTHTIKATIAETTNYNSAEATSTFTIAKADINPTLSITGWTYGDAANDPTVTDNTGNGSVTYTYAIQADVPTYSATVPTAAGSYIVKAVIAETANYNGVEKIATFTIAKANFDNVVIADIDDQTFTGEALTPAITVTFKGNAVDASEYEANYASNTNVGTATVTLTSNNVNFVGGQTNPSKTFQIVPAQAVITANNQNVTYDGKEQAYTNYTVTNGSVVVRYYGSEADRTAGENELEVARNAGTYYVKLEQNNANYTSEPVNATFTIDPKTLTDEMVWIEYENGNFVYDGQAKTLEEGEYGITDYDLDDDLKENTDFTIAYTNNTNVGTATVTFTGMGNYQGTATKTFSILRELNISFTDTRQWATYYAEENLAIPEGLKAYIVTGISGTDVTAAEITYIPKHVAVLLTYEDEYDDEYLAAAYTGATQTYGNNLLWGTSAATNVEDIDGGNVYVLYNNEFVKSVSGTIPANRGYLIVGAAHARSLGIVIDDHATGINDVRGQMVDARGAYYNLQGQRVSKTQKGLIIVNGKKVLVK